MSMATYPDKLDLLQNCCAGQELQILLFLQSLPEHRHERAKERASGRTTAQLVDSRPGKIAVKSSMKDRGGDPREGYHASHRTEKESTKRQRHQLPKTDMSPIEDRWQMS